MPQTREDRMFKHYQSLMKTYGHSDYADGAYPEERAKRINDNVWLFMARRWKMPVRQVKDIIQEYRRNHAEVQDAR